MHLSQPALTRSIQSLEQELDLLICDRHPRGIVLTQGGKMVVERARRVLFESRALDRDVRLFNSHELGDVSFGVGPYPAAILLTHVHATLSKSYRQLSIRTEVENWTTLLERLHAEAIDFFVVEKRTMPSSPDLAVVPLSLYECGWFARPRHPTFQKEKCTMANLREMQIASIPVPDALRESFRKALQYKASEPLHFHIECNSFFALRELAAESDTVIYGPLAAVQRELKAGTLRRIVVENAKALSMEFAIVYLAHRTLSPTAEKVIEAIIECDRLLHA
ncbi:LysR family transcriptional regulator [Massilia cavernae]|uniref:LysR family transcriptional regulator n=1 Tax=Massilia cavernae TaxID=2320864 RepID=A0A418XSQ1_9BURK|nr:LysR family transcriptional regulator [Massilia cavernae]RJG15612.1 LysR family transcriptional regulator [Massilia cavernae]